MNKLLSVIITSTFLLSCAETQPHITVNKTDENSQQTSTKNLKYTCSRNIKLSINFTSMNKQNDKSIAIINGFGEQAIILPSKAVASGFLYSNGKYSLRGKGEQATFTVGRMVPFQCSIGDKLKVQEYLK